MMVQGALRVLLLIWALFFAALGVRGLLDPQVFGETLGMTDVAQGGNTLRADFAAFFLVAAAGAALAAIRPRWAAAALVPAALFGTAMICRAIGLALGDAVARNAQSMIVEAVSAALMIAAWRLLSRPRSL